MDFTTFSSLSLDEMAPYCLPNTVIYAPAGTRRRLAIEQISFEDYARWGAEKVTQNLQLLCKYGAKHILIPAIGPDQLQKEDATYSSRLFSWLTEFYQLLSASPTWRVKTLGSPVPSLPQSETVHNHELPCIWLYILSDRRDTWRDIILASQRVMEATRDALVQEMYGEVIDPVKLYIGFGRLVMRPGILPPALFDDELDMYWTQKAGFSLTEPMLRNILYDYHIARNTMANRSERYRNVDRLKALWDTEQIVGTGTNINGFWYPSGFHCPKD